MHTWSRACFLYQGGKGGGSLPQIPGLKPPSAYTDGHVPQNGPLQLPSGHGPSAQSAQAKGFGMWGCRPLRLPLKSIYHTPDQGPVCTWAAPPPSGTPSSDLAWDVEDAVRNATRPG